MNDQDVPRVNTVFIRSRPARGVGVPYKLPTPTATRRPAGHYVPPTILAVFVAFTFMAPVVFWFAWLVFAPILWLGWQFGIPANQDKRRAQGKRW